MDPMQYLSGMALPFLYCETFNVLDFKFCMDLPWLPKHESSGDFCMLGDKRREHCKPASVLGFGGILL